MYRNRKKMLLIAGTSVVVLAGFGAGAWAIIDSSSRIPSDNEMLTQVVGATTYGDSTPLEYNRMSVSDWMFYNMPKFAVPIEESSEGITSINFYKAIEFEKNSAEVITEKVIKSDKNKENLLYTVKISKDMSTQEVWTKPSSINNDKGIRLVKSIIKDRNITNEYYWSSNVEDIILTGDSNQLNYSLNNGSSILFTSENNTSTARITDLSNIKTWERKTEVSNNRIQVEFGSEALTGSETISQTFSLVEQKNGQKMGETDVEKGISYYSIEYKLGKNQSIDKKSDLLDLIKFNKETSKSYISTNSEYSMSYIPIILKNN